MQRKTKLAFVLMALSLPILLSAPSLGSQQCFLTFSICGEIVYPPEPKLSEGYVYLGAWLQGNMPAIYNEWVSQTGKGLYLYATMACLGQPDTPVPNTGAPWMTLTQRLQEASQYMEQGLYDTVGLTWMTSYNGEDTGSGATEATQRVAAGEYDNFLRNTAQWIDANFPYELIIRLDQEFNLYHFGWSNDPDVFISAWRRIVNIFRTEGINVQWFWCPNWNDNPSSLHFEDYYPGDDYVDWIGIDLYAANWATDAETQLGWNNNAIYNFALSHNKPFMIGEWGVNMSGDLTDQQNAYWLSTFFDGIEARPEIKALVHWGGWDWSLLAKDGSGNYKYPQTIQTYADRVSGSRYIS